MEPARGTHPTPPALARELVEALLGAGPAPSLLDPACGEGELLLAAHRLGIAAERLHGIEIDPARARRAERRLAEHGAGAARILCADALAGEVRWPGGTSILANPPWVSFSGRHAATPPTALPSLNGPWPSLHGAFLVAISKHVSNERTKAAVLLPSSLCELERYGGVRRQVTAQARVISPPRELGESAFPGVVEPATLLLLGPRTSNDPASPAPWSTTRGSELLSALAAHPRLPPDCFGDIGVHTGNASAQLLLPPESRSPAALPIREGRDLVAFHLSPARRRIRTDLERTPERRFRIPPLERHQAIPILVRQTARHPIAALHTDPGLFRNSLLAVRPPPDLDPAFVVAVLNGTVARSAHRLSFLDARQRTFPQVKVAHLRAVPFPFTRRADSPRLHDRVAAAVRSFSAERGGPSAEHPALRRALADLERAYELSEDLVATDGAGAASPIRSR
ncbi:MAG TPA: hypothetical protein ENJ09_00495 [Planctomycetes bacterium]|nr:hypothetical protein [Planctomycetota bacterium]